MKQTGVSSVSRSKQEPNTFHFHVGNFCLYREHLPTLRAKKALSPVFFDVVPYKSRRRCGLVWGNRNRLHLNSFKCQVITFNRSRTQINFPYHLGDNLMQRVAEVKDLGVMLDGNLKFRRHMDRIISKCRSTLGLAKRFTKEFGDVNVARTLYCSLVRPITEYAAPVWTPNQMMSYLQWDAREFRDHMHCCHISTDYYYSDLIA